MTILVKLMVLHNTFNQHKTIKKELRKELMLAAWHPKRWCIKVAGIVSFKINMLINTYLLNRTVRFCGLKNKTSNRQYIELLKRGFKADERLIFCNKL